MESVKKFKLFKVVFVALSICCFVPCVAVADQSAWDRAGQQIGEAARAVGDASAESWQKTKKASSNGWDKTKEVSGETWDKTKKGSAKAVDSGGDALDSAGDKAATLWDKTKKGTSSWFNRTKQNVHDMTAPETTEN